MKRLILFVTGLLIITVSLVAGACSAGSNTGNTPALESKLWVLQTYGNPEHPSELIPETRITVVFGSTEGQVAGTAGCNNYFGSYEVNGAALTIPNQIVVTERYCLDPEGTMDQEQDYLALLPLAQSFEINNGELTINCGTAVFIFK